VRGGAHIDKLLLKLSPKGSQVDGFLRSSIQKRKGSVGGGGDLVFFFLERKKRAGEKSLKGAEVSQSLEEFRLGGRPRESACVLRKRSP